MDATETKGRHAVGERLTARLAAALETNSVALLAPADLDLGVIGRVRCAAALVRNGSPGLAGLLLAIGLGWGVQRDGLLDPCAAAEVPEVWWLDLEHRLAEIYRAPAEGRYRWRTVAFPGEAVALPARLGEVVLLEEPF